MGEADKAHRIIQRHLHRMKIEDEDAFPTHTHTRVRARARGGDRFYCEKSSKFIKRPHAAERLGSEPADRRGDGAHCSGDRAPPAPLRFAALSGFACRMAWQFLRLVLFVILLLPYFLRPTLLYALSSNIQHGVRYGSSVRCAVDVYLPLDAQGKVLTGARRPVVVFVSGGAWIIGFRMWGFLLGLALQRRGVVCVSVDYRNFPQARMDAMVDDVSAACDWVEAHAESLGGDPCNISVVGQSAGAH